MNSLGISICVIYIKVNAQIKKLNSVMTQETMLGVKNLLTIGYGVILQIISKKISITIFMIGSHFRFIPIYRFFLNRLLFNLYKWLKK